MMVWKQIAQVQLKHIKHFELRILRILGNLVFQKNLDNLLIEASIQAQATTIEKSACRGHL